MHLSRVKSERLGGYDLAKEQQREIQKTTKVQTLLQLQLKSAEIQRSRSVKLCPVMSDPQFRCITLKGLRNFIKSNGISTEKTWRDVGMSIIFPKTKGQHKSYLELIGEMPRVAAVYVTFTWHVTLKDFMSGIENLARARQLKGDETFWLYPLAFDYHSEENLIADHWNNAMKASDLCAYICVSDDQHLRPGPLLDLYTAISLQKATDLLSPAGALALSRPFEATRCWQYASEAEVGQLRQNFDVDIARGLMHLEKIVADRSASETQDQKWQAVLKEVTVSHREDVNYSVRCAAAGPYLHQAAFYDDVKAVENVWELCPTLVGSNLSDARELRGPSNGETILHTAAAAGSTKVMSLLLENQADPNAVDLVGETPLHYAAQNCELNAITLLLQFNANATAQSFKCESPANLAEKWIKADVMSDADWPETLPKLKDFHEAVQRLQSKKQMLGLTGVPLYVPMEENDEVTLVQMELEDKDMQELELPDNVEFSVVQRAVEISKKWNRYEHSFTGLLMLIVDDDNVKGKYRTLRGTGTKALNIFKEEQADEFKERFVLDGAFIVHPRTGDVQKWGCKLYPTAACTYQHANKGTKHNSALEMTYDVKEGSVAVVRSDSGGVTVYSQPMTKKGYCMWVQDNR